MKNNENVVPEWFLHCKGTVKWLKYVNVIQDLNFDDFVLNYDQNCFDLKTGTA